MALTCRVALVITIAMTITLFAGETAESSEPALNLSYDVLYGGYKIGEIDITQSLPFQHENKTVSELECRIESSVLIDHRGFYRSLVDSQYTVFYLKADNNTAGRHRIDEFWFDYDKGEIRIKTDYPKKGESSNREKDISQTDRTYFDAISMIFRLREALDTLKAPFYVPVFVYSRPDSILIKSIRAVSVTDSSGENRPVKHVTGYIPFDTFPGVGREFEIHISDDGEKIPVKAEIRMALGRVEIIPRRR